MNTRTWPYGTRRVCKVLEDNPRVVREGKAPVSILVVEDDANEAHIIIDGARDVAIAANATGEIVFTKGGPMGGYWKFTEAGK